MKFLITVLASTFFLNAYATVDVSTNITVVVVDYNEVSGFNLNKVPADFCVGIAPLALAMAITQPVTIKTGYGCGMPAIEAQVNVLNCATIEATEVVNPDGSYNARNVTVSADLRNCSEFLAQEYFESYVERAVFATWNDHGFQVVNYTVIK